jgi:glycosyltransferase involved in cell wall biosynthesis
MKVLFGTAAAVLFVSKQQEEFVRSLGISGRFMVVPNPVNDQTFRVGRGGFPDEIRLITAGHLIPRKRHNLLIAAFADARRSEPRLKLEILGSGECLSVLQEQAMAAGVTKSVTFLGRLDRQLVADLMARSDIYVHTSDTETFGVAIVEALFSGLPVVVSKAGGVTESIPASMGITVPGADAQQFATAILDIVHRLPTIQRQEIAAEARSMFSTESVAIRIGEIYRDVTGSSTVVPG